MIKPRIYVAGSSSERATVAEYMDRLSDGWTVAYRWPDVINGQSRPDHALTEAECSTFASECLSGVAAAEMFWLVSPTKPSTGAWIEYGFALGHLAADRVVVSGPRQGIFQFLGGRYFPQHESALGWLQTPFARQVADRGAA